MSPRQNPPFVNRMTRVQTILGWLYLPMHVLILPILLQLFSTVTPDPLSAAQINLIYFGVAVVYLLAVMFSWLRGCFDVLLDNLPFCILTVITAFLATYALGILAALVLILMDSVENPNNAAVMQAAGADFGVTAALTVFIGPIVEETLFRGVVFGSLRKFGRIPAYAVSALLFSFFHVWQYALVEGDPALLFYAVQYLPSSILLAWCYERTGSIWTGIFFHMAYNGIAFWVLGML